MLRWLLAGLLCFPTLVMATKATPSPRLDPDGLVADARLLEAVYGALHPGLYRYNTPAQIRAHFAELRRELRRRPTLPSAYVAFARLAAAIRCGHTYPNYWNQSKSTAAALFQGANRVPFRFRWFGQAMVVTDSSLPGLPVGTRVLTIDGVPAGRILHTLMPLVPADGSNDAKRIDELNVLGGDRYEAFDVFYPLVFPVRDGRFMLDVERPGEMRPATLTVQAMTDADRAAALPVPDKDGPVWTIRYTEEGQAVLTMPTWALYKSTWDWRGWLDATFAELARRHVRTLVIDVRANGGGLDVGDEVLAHLTTHTLHFPGYRELVRYRKVPDAFIPYLDTWDTSFRDWGDRAQPYDARFYRRIPAKNDTSDENIEPRAPHFDGRVSVLVGPTNSSATFGFATRLKASGLGTLVGSTTGGNQRGINGGAFFFLRLPHSGIELDVPLVGQFPTEPRPDAGVDPDVRVVRTWEDVAKGRDTELARALSVDGVGAATDYARKR